MKPIARTVATISVLGVLGVLAGCGQTDSSGAGVDAGSEPDGRQSGRESDAPVAGPVCPDPLPGSGTEPLEAAPAAPELPPVETAWVCEYSPIDGDDDGPGWQLDGDEVEVAPEALPPLRQSLAGLEPADGDRFCTGEIGSRWLVVTADAGGDTTGVVVDGFGCGDVRLTDDPAGTTPGAARQSGGLVGGVLTGPEGLAAALAALHRG